MDLSIFTLSLSVVVVECVISTLKLLHKPSVWPSVNLGKQEISVCKYNEVLLIVELKVSY